MPSMRPFSRGSFGATPGSLEPTSRKQQEIADLTPKQHKAIAALLTEPTIGAAATAAGVGERTLYTWLGDAGFRVVYLAARREAVGQAVAQLQRISSEAVLVLQSVMNDATKPASARIAAARSVLEFSIKAVEMEELEQRLVALEAAYAKQQKL